ncbi:hypothetical protein RHGRI_029082 [Rhododendron griersonianum]|uniref:Uncharacterized protein n=1 Tax=Rhododendron griersonianum TaxID=479676 RepID=A0AAV6INV7_9ERIC|nr:hypothetical protein RHGRI_029082 [Rhododendron griersonianum]
MILKATTKTSFGKMNKMGKQLSLPSARRNLKQERIGSDTLRFEPGTYLNQKEKLIKYIDFVYKELILFSMADLQRSIPSITSGTPRLLPPPIQNPYPAAITHQQAPPTSSQVCLSSSSPLPPKLSMETSTGSSPSIDKQEIVDPSIHHDLESEDHTMDTMKVEKQVTDVVVTEQKPQQEGDTSTLGSYVGPSTIPTSTCPPYDYTEHFTTETVSVF